MSASGRAIIERFNAQAPGTVFEARVEEYSPALRMWLLEAGARHRAVQEEGSWRLEIRRGAAPAQGRLAGVHHVVSDGASVWTCERGQRVARIDVETGRPVSVKALARKASHLALDAARGRLIVADSEANELIVLRAADLALENRWSAPGAPQLPRVAPDGTVCVTGGAADALTIVRDNRARTISVGACPHDPLLDADGTHLFVPCAGGAELVKVRLADATIVGRCAVGNGPSHLALHPDGTRVVATGFASDHVRVFDAGFHRELARVAVGVGSSHSVFAGGAAYVGYSVADHVACLSLASFTVQRRIAIH